MSYRSHVQAMEEVSTDLNAKKTSNSFLVLDPPFTDHERVTVLGSRRKPIREHLASSSPMSLEDFMKPKSGNQRDRSRSKTITTTSSDDKLSSYPYMSDIEHLVETSPQKPDKEEDPGTGPKIELDEGYAEGLATTPVVTESAATDDKPQEVRHCESSSSSFDLTIAIQEALSGPVRTYMRPNGVIVATQWSPAQKMWITLENYKAPDSPNDRAPSSQHNYAASNPASLQKAAEFLTQGRVQPAVPFRAQEFPNLSAHSFEPGNLRRTVLHDPYRASQSNSAMSQPVSLQNAPPLQEHPFDYGSLSRSTTMSFGSGLAPTTMTQSGLEYIGSSRPRPMPPARTGSMLNVVKDAVPSEMTDEELLAAFPLVPHRFNPASYLTTVPQRQSGEADLQTFWHSGQQKRTRQKEYIGRHIAASSKSVDGDARVAMGVFVPVFENLHWYSTQKSLAAHQVAPSARWGSGVTTQPAAANKDYFARFVDPPEWCIDRNMALGAGKSTFGESKVQTFFGELEWVKAPERVGRDPRYRPMMSRTNSGDVSGRRAKLAGTVFGSNSSLKNIAPMPGMGRFG